MPNERETVRETETERGVGVGWGTSNTKKIDLTEFTLIEICVKFHRKTLNFTK